MVDRHIPKESTMRKSGRAAKESPTSVEPVTRPVVVFVGADQSENLVECNVGESLMKAAVNNAIEGIEGECGGNLSCGTCHIFVLEEPEVGVPPAEQQEADLLDALVDNLRPTSRLGCQVKMTAELNNLRVGIGNA
jgi:ferredoxin, 2Fe-2S